MPTESEEETFISELRELVEMKQVKGTGDNTSKTKWALAMQAKIDLCLRVPYGTRFSSNLAASERLNVILPWSEYYAKNKNYFPGVQASDVLNHDPVLNSKVSLWQGDITTLGIDCIVNSVNEKITGIKASVDNAITRAAGPALKEELRLLDWCRKDEALITKGFRLPAKYIIHITRPRGKKVTALQRCYQMCLEMMVKHNLRSIAFPTISTGFFGLSSEENAKAAVETVRNFLADNSSKVDRIIFCTFTENATKVYWEMLCTYFPVEKPVRDADPSSWVSLRSVFPWPLYYQLNEKYFRGVDYTPDDGKLPVNTRVNDRVSLWQGDITLLQIDCIVKYEEADSSSLVSDQDRCKPVLTPLHSPAKALIRMPLPACGDGVCLRNSFWNCLELMIKHKYRTIAFPCICSESVGFSPEEALPVVIETVRIFIKFSFEKIGRVVFCTNSNDDTQLYQDVMKAYLPVE